jgi:hypothetical protein
VGVILVGYADRLWRELGLLQERQRWFQRALAFVEPTTPPSIEARIRLGLGWDFYGGDRTRLSHNRRAIALLRQVGSEPVLLGEALMQAGHSTSRDGDLARQSLEEGLAILRQYGRTKRLAIALLIAGGNRRDAGDLRAARALVEEGLVLSRALGDDRLRDTLAAQLALIAFLAGQTAEAIDRARRAVEASRRHGTLPAEFVALHWLAGFLLLGDQIEPGRAAALQAFELSRALGADLPGSIDRLALVLAARGEVAAAAHLAGFADSYANAHRLNRGGLGIAIRNRLLERLDRAMNPEECQAAMAAGAAWSEQEAVAAAVAA